MAQQVRVPFGTTAETLKSAILETCRQNNWEPSRIYFVIDLNACTVKETVYAVSNRTSDLPLHPDGPNAVQRLS
jgi:hypothetical protein